MTKGRYAKWSEEMKALKDVRNIDELASMFKLPDWNTLDENNLDYYVEAGAVVYKCNGCGETGDKSDFRNVTCSRCGGEDVEMDEEATYKAEDEIRDDTYDQWHAAVEYVANQIFEQHGLKLVEKKRKGQRYPYEYKIVPEKSWEDAAGAIIDTINGVGMFYFSSVKEFLESGPYTARQAVLSHLHWMKERASVYGTTSAERMFENHWR